MTPGDYLDSLGRGSVALAPTLATWISGECIGVTVLPAGPMLERDVVCVDHLYPPRGLSYRVLAAMQQTHSAIVLSHCDFLPLEITFEMFEGPDHHQQFLTGSAIPLLALLPVSVH